jgi:protein-S-isoprenylcysteine O-methyltransferase Ste14
VSLTVPEAEKHGPSSWFSIHAATPRWALQERVGVGDPPKAWLARHVAPHLERTTYVWVASLLFALTSLAWQPVPGRLWQVTGPAAWVLTALPLLGVVIALAAARHLDVFDLAGLRQAFAAPRPPRESLVDTGLYGLVRHPIYLGWLCLVWPTPDMTGTHFAFAAISTSYLALAVPIEERTLRAAFGAEYDAYRRKVRWRMVPFVY